MPPTNFQDFLKVRREELHISQQEVADRLSSRGHETSYSRVSHWERGRNKPPLEDPAFRQALAATLEMDVNELMSRLGYVVYEDMRSREARIASEIVDRLPIEGKELAVELLHTLEKRYS